MSYDTNDGLDVTVRKNEWAPTGFHLSLFGVHYIILIPIIFGAFAWFLDWEYRVGGLIVSYALLFALKRAGFTASILFAWARSKLGGRRMRRHRYIGNHRIWR